MRDRMARMEKLIQLLLRGVTPEPNAGQPMRMLAARYNKAIANHSPRETWMEQVEFLIAPARLVQPELGTLAALRAAMPRGFR